MAIKFNQEQIKTEVIVAREVVKDVVSGDIELQKHENDCQVNEILDVKAQVKDVNTTIADGGVEINGILCLDVIYNVEEMYEEDEDTYINTYHQEARIEFENFIDVPEAEAGMHVFLNVRVADINYEVLETDMLEVAVTLIKYCAVSEIRELNCITDISGIPEDEVVEEQVRIAEWIGDESIKATVASEIEVDDVEKVLCMVGEVVKADYTTMENAVTCEGVIEVNILYLSCDEEDPIKSLDQRIEFNHTLDLYGVEPGMSVYGNYKLTDLDVQQIGEDTLRAVCQVECYAKVTKPHRITVVTDVMNDMIDSEKETVTLQEMVGQNKVRENVVHRINVPPTRPDAQRVLQCYSRVKDLTSMVNNGGVLVEGNLEGTVYYLGEEEYCHNDVIVCLKDLFDFDNYVPVEECEEGMEVYVEVDVCRTSCQVLNDRTLEMNILLEKCVKVSSMIEFDCVTDLVAISPIVEEPCPPSYIVYVVQKGDTLWKIARRYKVNLDSLIEVNDIENPDQLEVGQKICIPKALIGAKG